MVTEKKSIAEAMKSLNKKYGAGTIRQNDSPEDFKVESFPTGSLKLDYLFGCGGLPKGRVIELFGPEGGGKSTLAYWLVAEVQRQGGSCVWVDAENCFESKRAQVLGVQTNDLFVTRPSFGEQAFDMIQMMVETSSIALVVVDSVAALVPKAELEADFSDKHIALHPRMMSAGLRKIGGAISINNTTVIFVNQLREKTGITYGLKEITPGGKALPFYSSVRLAVKKGEKFKREDGSEFGNEMIIEARKNKVGMPGRKIMLDLLYDKGIDLLSEVYDEGVERGVIEKTGNTLSYEGKKIGVGKEASKEFLRENKEVFDKIRKDVALAMSTAEETNKTYGEEETPEEDF